MLFQFLPNIEDFMSNALDFPAIDESTNESKEATIKKSAAKLRKANLGYAAISDAATKFGKKGS
jgi:hypothetical protein